MANCGLQDIHPSSLPSINASAPLAILDLRKNFVISSSTLHWFLNFSKSLTFIDLSYNNITGGLISTHSFDNQIFLSHLDLVHNALEDGIPKSFGNMSSLIYLKLEGNHLTAQLSGLMMNLSGPLEKKLQHLDLSGNMISGPLPNFSRFSFLNRLGLGGNNLDDSIANGFLNIPHLIHLDLSSNNLSGRIPQNIGFQLVNLESLDLSRNYLYGDIPISFSELRFLEVLDLSYNNLSGRIPLQIAKFDESAYMGNSGLCGYPTLKSCPEEDDIDHQDSNFNSDGDTMDNLEHEDDKLITEGFYICMGIGFFLGLWWVCIFQIVGLWSIRRRTQN